jgi:hypothetical protein
MNTKHTPGPWHIDRDAFERAARLKGGDNMRLILRWGAFARRSSADVEIEANARLIAAAPDLLEALQTLVQMTGNVGQIEAFLNGPARAAIAKATNG